MKREGLSQNTEGPIQNMKENKTKTENNKKTGKTGSKQGRSV